MINFLRDLFARPGAARTVILLEPDSMSAPRQYEVRPGHAVYAAVIAVVVLAAVLVAALVVTPLRGLLVGPGSDELRATAERNASRAQALDDSLAAQVEQIELLRALITGEPADSGASAVVPLGAASVDVPAPRARPAPDAAPASGPPAARAAETLRLTAATEAYLTGLRAPALLPVDGVVSRGFAPERGHFGVDIAAASGTPVLAAGAGTVVLADWTQDGGLTVAVQHPGGYLSMYKHNSRLLRRAGERVDAREAVAVSGSTGRITTGPHLHVEVWRDGVAQDPARFFLLR